MNMTATCFQNPHAQLALLAAHRPLDSRGLKPSRFARGSKEN